MLNCRGQDVVKKMKGQHSLVGPQRPSTHDRLFASLPITRNLIFSDARIKIGSCTVGPSIFSRPSKAAARHPTLKPSLSNGQMRTPTREQGATSQSWPTSIGISGCAGSEALAGFLEIRNAIAMPAAGDRSVVASARLVARGGTTAPRVLTIWIVRAWHWLNHAVASSAERG
jgi:hypothetical protein